MTKEHPILFSDALVRAILDGRKTQTRRILTARNILVNGTSNRKLFEQLDLSSAWVDRGPSPAGNSGPYLKAPTHDGSEVHRIYPRIWGGDVLWVREGWGCWPHMNGDYQRETLRYRATDDPPDNENWRWRPSIHMPKWAYRIRLEVIGVRPERLHDITDAAAVLEGAQWRDGGKNQWGQAEPGWSLEDPHPIDALGQEQGQQHCLGSPRSAFANKWNKLHKAPKGYYMPWDYNCWVWVITFKRIQSSSRDTP